MSDAVNHPQHYNSHPSGIEAIEICQHLDFCLGNAVKYLWRAGKKAPQQIELGADGAVQDLKKAAWYLDRSVKSRKAGHSLFRSIPSESTMNRVINADPVGGVLRDVLELVVRPYIEHREPKVMDALLRVEREIAERSK